MSITPNRITAIRVAAAFAAVALFGHGAWADSSALLLTVAAISLDALDGYVARRWRLETPLGAQLDILGDRLIENVFFTYFAVRGEISLWVPVLFFMRGMATDFVRSLAVKAGRSGGFGRNSMLDSNWARAIVASRPSRAAYGALKCVCFCYLGTERAVLAEGISHVTAIALARGAQAIVWLTVAYCLLRGIPVLWEGRQYFTKLATPAATAAARPDRHAQVRLVGAER